MISYLDADLIYIHPCPKYVMAKKKNTVKCIQKNIVKHRNRKFTVAQIKEQKQFGIALKQNKAQIIFSGSFKDGLSFLKETGNLVDTINNS